VSSAARYLELCAALDAIAREGIYATGYFARRAPLWAELSRLSSYERPPTQPSLFEET